MAVKIGVCAFATEDGLDFVELARRAEALGFESLWAPEHGTIPVGAATPYPDGGAMPELLKHIGDPLVALAAAAGATHTLRLGTCVSLVPQHDPKTLAKQVATLDLLSHGRLHLGIGAGWLREESETMGVDFKRRWSQTREHVLAMQALWTQEQAAFAGKYVSFPPLWCWPKPLQKPYPPILIGGELAKAAERIAEYGDGWMPRYRAVDPAAVETGRARIAALLRARGRPSDALDVTLWGCKPERAVMRSYEDAGVTRFLLVLRPEEPQASLRRLEDTAEKVL
ncbi:MAG TPA: LLM class F420-dependent oxidoreductase [bacterium]|nr:LLM class F420-dependent oxidoreductase [bacterium]